MNFSGYFLFAASAMLAFIVQQTYAASDSDDVSSKRARATIRIINQSCDENIKNMVAVNATSRLQYSYNQGTIIINQSEDKIKNGISEARNLVREDPQAAKNIIDAAFADAKKLIYKAGIIMFAAEGDALVLSNNNGSRQRLETASIYIQNAGMCLLDSISIAENLSDEGIEAGGEAAEVVIGAINSTMEGAYAYAYENFQKAIREANQGLRDPQSSPNQGQFENQNCETASNDPDSSDAINEINEAANNALERGADADLVQEFKKVFLCSLGDLANITVEARNTIDVIKTVAKIDSLATKILFFKLTRSLKDINYEIAARLFTVVGAVARQSGNQSNNSTGESIFVLETGKVDNLLAIDSAKEIIVIGSRSEGDALLLAVRAAYKILLFGKIALVQAIAEGAKIVLRML